MAAENIVFILSFPSKDLGLCDQVLASGNVLCEALVQTP